MKKLITLIVLLFFAVTFNSHAFNPLIVCSGEPEVAAGSSYNIEETWDSTGSDLTWTAVPSGWDEDSTTDPPDGAQSLETAGAGNVHNYISEHV